MKKKKFSAPKVDKIEELSAELLVANQKLRDSEAARTKMLENISHDLRAPLTAVRSTVEYLQELNPSQELDWSEWEQIINLLDMRTKTLEALVSDLYYLTCLDNEKISMSYEQVPLGQFLEEYFYSVESDQKYAERMLYLEVPEEATAEVSIDVHQMTRVLDNLFTNALKYSDKGASITLGMEKPQESVVIFYVKDTGMGIPKGALEKIFERTYTVSDARTPSKQSGSGFGLAIVQSIVKKHCGKITCMSELGIGSIFIIELPKI